jgi:hypothetical protein
MSITELPSMEAEYLAPTTDTGLIPLVSPDRRFTKLRDASGQVAAHLVKIPLDAAGLPAYQRALPAHSGARCPHTCMSRTTTAPSSPGSRM